jgi:hypothetical protein
MSSGNTDPGGRFLSYLENLWSSDEQQLVAVWGEQVKSDCRLWSVEQSAAGLLFCVCVELRFELRAFTLSHSTSPFW